MNIIKLLGIEYKEDIISNFIVGLINESKSFRDSFLKNIIKIECEENVDIKAYTRIKTSFGVPDIIISLEGGNYSTLIIIENKLKAEEGENQTLRYSNEKCIKELVENKKIFEFYTNNIDVKFIFLTLIPNTNPTGSDFKNITYKELIEKVNVKIEDETLNKLYKDFSIIINDFYKDLEFNENDNLFEYLNKEDNMERLFIKFKKIIKKLKFTNDINISDVTKLGANGRVSFYAKINKDNWIGEDVADLIEGKYNVTENSYNIHIEPSFDVFNNKVILPLHYETRPYITLNKLKNNTDKENYKAYFEKRDKVKKLIHKKIYELNDKNIKTYNGSNQIASVKINIDEETTIKEFIDLLKKYIIIICKIVDSCLL